MLRLKTVVLYVLHDIQLTNIFQIKTTYHFQRFVRKDQLFLCELNFVELYFIGVAFIMLSTLVRSMHKKYIYNEGTLT